ncbi:hypothetical protein RFF05_09500 [Bengtsoniella intestinalis]|uniref:hypothetical protein n=1 Tax=Bengtsoniella intestinalis TaxID=3073143 RepID=UPI00391F48E5
MNNTLLTISDTQRQLALDGIAISTFTLRRWAREGTIPAFFSGNKIFLHYPTVLAVLTNGTAV